MSDRLSVEIFPSPYWTGSGHGTRYVCMVCAGWWLTPEELRQHIEVEHPEVEIVEREA